MGFRVINYTHYSWLPPTLFCYYICPQESVCSFQIVHLVKNPQGQKRQIVCESNLRVLFSCVTQHIVQWMGCVWGSQQLVDAVCVCVQWRSARLRILGWSNGRLSVSRSRVFLSCFFGVGWGDLLGVLPKQRDSIKQVGARCGVPVVWVRVLFWFYRFLEIRQFPRSFLNNPNQ